VDAAWLLLSMVYSTIGLGMFVYGKKAVRFVPLIAGVLLMIVPYCFASLFWMTLASAGLMASPFLLATLEG